MLYCAHCGAPQIRVPEALLAPEEQPQPTVAPPPPPGALSWKDAVPVAAKVGTVVGILMLPLSGVLAGALLMLWLMVGGWLAVRRYERRVRAVLATRSAGALGGLTGLFAFGVFAIILAGVMWLDVAVLHQGNETREMMRKALEQAATAQGNAQALQFLDTPAGLAIFIALLLLVMLVLSLLLSSVGALFAAAMRRRK